MGNADAIRRLPQVSPAQIGFKKAYDRRSAVHGRDGTVGHYTGTKNYMAMLLAGAGDLVDREMAALRAIEKAHTDKGWDGFGYNDSVGPSGTLYRGRGESRGAHNPGDSDRDGRFDNLDTWGFLFQIGPNETPTREMVATAFAYFDAAPGGLYAHRDSRSTACPGDIINGVLSDYRNGRRDLSKYPSVRANSGASPTPTEGEKMKKTDKGPGVKAAQEALLRWDSKCLPQFGADSDYGDETADAVGRFQKSYGLTSVTAGVAGGVTVGLLLGEHGPSGSGGGMSSSDVAAIAKREVKAWAAPSRHAHAHSHPVTGKLGTAREVEA
jgi:hypothetical protein